MPPFPLIGGGASTGKRMQERPLVSVITPFLDAEAFIEEAIESVLAQTYDHWELLLVDDGSTDGSAAIARAASRRCGGKIRYMEHSGHTNRGISASINLGLMNALGHFIAFLDADDCWLPDRLERDLALIQANSEAGMLVGASVYWYSWTGHPRDAGRDQLITVGAPQDMLIHPPELLLHLYPLGLGAAPCPGSLLVRREMVELVQGFEECFRVDYSDQGFLTKIYLGTPVFVTSNCGHLYRRHPGSTVSVMLTDGRYHTVREQFLTWFENYLVAQGEPDAQIWQSLQDALLRYRHPARFFVDELRRSPAATVRSLAKAVGRRALPGVVYCWLKAVHRSGIRSE